MKKVIINGHEEHYMSTIKGNSSVCGECGKKLKWEEQWDMNYKAECSCGYTYGSVVTKVYVGKHYDKNLDNRKDK